MTLFDAVQIFLLLALLFLSIPLLGNYIKKIFKEERTPFTIFLAPVERFSYRITRIDPTKEMNWKQYALSLLLFNFIGFLALFAIQLMQGFLPLNPEHLKHVSWPLAFNISSSFVTNTNWQSYAGETTLSYFTQMMGLTVQNFLSAATGLSVLFVFIRGMTRKETESLGNFWVDLVRIVTHLFLPLSILFSFFLLSQGVVQTFSSYQKIMTLEEVSQTIPLGPVASQVAIKQLGSNGGGFFQANSSHPFENPTALSNFFELFAILLIPASLTYTFGSLVGSKRHGWLLFFAMFTLWIGGIALSCYSEYQNNPLFNASPMMEGKETRIGVFQSILWSTSTTAVSNGSVNAMLSSLSPLAGGVALFNIMLGELIFGGVGVGLSSMIMFALLTLFLSGLMIGRTPEYLGKKIEKREVQWISMAILLPCALILIGSGLSSIFRGATSHILNPGPHGLTEILYAFSSASGNNGSAFAGLDTNSPFFNVTLGFVMQLGRLAILIPTLGLAGQLVRKKISPPNLGTFSTDTLLFLVLLIGVILVVGALTFFPALSLGPLVEHFLMLKGEGF